MVALIIFFFWFTCAEHVAAFELVLLIIINFYVFLSTPLRNLRILFLAFLFCFVCAFIKFYFHICSHMHFRYCLRLRIFLCSVLAFKLHRNINYDNLKWFWEEENLWKCFFSLYFIGFFSRINEGWRTLIAQSCVRRIIFELR